MNIRTPYQVSTNHGLMSSEAAVLIIPIILIVPICSLQALHKRSKGFCQSMKRYAVPRFKLGWGLDQ
jgi:hypothetical protein